MTFFSQEDILRGEVKKQPKSEQISLHYKSTLFHIGISKIQAVALRRTTKTQGQET